MRSDPRIAMLVLLALVLSTAGSFAQITQSIRGTVTDMQTGIPLIGATVVLLDQEPVRGTITDHQGYFNLADVPLGRQGIRIDYLGYHRVVLNSLEVTSGKAFTVNVQMEEKVIMGEEAVVRARSGKEQALNEMALVSARSFNMEETERYAGSWGDPARLVANFAGVQSPADQSNDIIIRGNSPTGLLWRMEGVSIYNPNHFGSIGSTGGPISMINNNYLADSDFYSGAFPAEYGNALSGVFDLNIRNGNNREHEFTAQVGFNGFEAGAEGPFSENSNASYLVGFRYSTLGFFKALGLDIGIQAVPFYQDLTFKVDVPLSEKDRISLFGLGGTNNIGTVENENGDYFSFDANAQTGAIGLSYKHYFNNKTRLRAIVSWGGIRNAGSDSSATDGLTDRVYGQHMTEQKYTVQADLRHRISVSDHLVGGLEVNHIRAMYRDSAYVPDYGLYFRLSNTSGTLYLYRAYLDWKHRFSGTTEVVAGVHAQAASLNNELAVEPRVSFRWKPAPGHEVTFGYGLHSQAQPRPVYFSETLVDTANLVYVQSNKDLGFTRSHQLVLGHQYLFNRNHRLKTELYYQKLFDVPVTVNPSYISMINYGGSFSFAIHDSLTNGGEGWNTGVEVTLERFFDNHFYYLATLSLFDSKYRASDGKVRNTLFNGNFILNLLGGYEWALQNQDAVTFDTRISWAGGLRVIPIDLEASRQAGETVRDYSRAYEMRDQDYFRLDVRLAYKWNRPRSTLTFAIDIQNLTNHINPFLKDYNPDTGEVEQVSQIGIIPSGLIRINF